MVYKVVWTPEALQTYLQVISYLENKWTEREVKNFARGVEDKIELLKKFSGIGSPFDKKRRLRKTLVHKQVQLYYRIRLQKRQVELVSFWNTYQNPNKLRRLR
ncbi:MAG TPA: type II toxin-antitoxin system RelE/ParE family toxin [Chitinophagaceae bacterium]|nr:type II toxin-antitoxin system RelE/ParE family toxin [Chitinophagaceae bacterium]